MRKTRRIKILISAFLLLIGITSIYFVNKLFTDQSINSSSASIRSKDHAYENTPISNFKTAVADLVSFENKRKVSTNAGASSISTPKNIKVLTISYDPSQNGDTIANKYFARSVGYPNAKEEAAGVFNQLASSIYNLTSINSNKPIQYIPLPIINVTDFPDFTFPDGVKLDINSYSRCLRGAPNPCENLKLNFDYSAWYQRYNICSLALQYGADEIWVISNSYFGTWEDYSVGPDYNAPVLNGPPLKMPGCIKHYNVLNATFDRPNLALHSYGHRVESFFKYMSRYWSDVDKQTYLEQFLNLGIYDCDGIFPCSSNFGTQVQELGKYCGNVHFAFNSLKEYEINSTNPDTSYCGGWSTYSFTPSTTPLNCKDWGCDTALDVDWKWQEYWMKNIPVGVNDSKFPASNFPKNSIITTSTGAKVDVNQINWWDYVTDLDSAIDFYNNIETNVTNNINTPIVKQTSIINLSSQDLLQESGDIFYDTGKDQTLTHIVDKIAIPSFQNGNGRVYIYEYPLLTTPVLEATITASDGKAGDLFGRHIAISGDNLIVYSPYHKNNDSTVGTIYFFKFNGTWNLVDEISVNSNSVSSVVIQNDKAEVSIPATFTPSVLTFNLVNNHWVKNTDILSATLSSPDGSFGSSMALFNNVLAINEGKVVDIYNWSQTSNKWIYTQQITQNDNNQNYTFGFSIAMYKDTMVISSIGLQANVLPGRVYIYKQDPSLKWYLSGNPLVLPTNSSSSSNRGSDILFGVEVSIVGEMIGVSAISTNYNIKPSTFIFIADSKGVYNYANSITNSSEIIIGNQIYVNNESDFHQIRSFTLDVNNTKPVCTVLRYSNWGSCNNGTQTRSIISTSVSNCTVNYSTVSQACNPSPTCIFPYSGWSVCKSQIEGVTKPISGNWDGSGWSTGLYGTTGNKFLLRIQSVSEGLGGGGSGGGGGVGISGGVGIKINRGNNIGLKSTTNSNPYFSITDAPQSTNLIPIAGDWTGLGHYGVGLYDPVSSTFYLKNNNTTGPSDLVFTFTAKPNLYPITGDWTGLGHTSVGLYDSSNGLFLLKNYNKTGSEDLSFSFGGSGNYIPLAGDWTGTGHFGVGIYNPVNGQFSLKNNNSRGVSDTVFIFGTPNKAPLSGVWQSVIKGFNVGVFDTSSYYFIAKVNPSRYADSPYTFQPDTIQTRTLLTNPPPECMKETPVLQQLCSAPVQ